jgi:hypothetical protein
MRAREFTQEDASIEIATSPRTARIMKQLRAANPHANSDLEALVFDYRRTQGQDRDDIMRLDQENDVEDQEIADIQRQIDVLKKQRNLREKKDACYNKVRSRYKVWPSAYASGALVQCRKRGAKNWGNKSKVNEGWRETLAALASAGVMAFSGGLAAEPVTDNPNKITATITIDGDTKIMDLTNKNFRDVREAGRWLENFLDQRDIENWGARIEKGVRGSGAYQRTTISSSGANLGASGR